MKGGKLFVRCVGFVERIERRKGRGGGRGVIGEERRKFVVFWIREGMLEIGGVGDLVGLGMNEDVRKMKMWGKMNIVVYEVIMC